ncbi:PREDICTED: von Willebrand factor D and EGF domain-containing protein-like [Branchiostoma belcheri]|uniref:von Willebrand factor D and EGF domain-containing protein-like n=1 Tax=Branchiostoma belcheri TaxID=7741 RepID=A0A6P4YBH9_BRABE|nr:PREDICTED: von Willebrand factor D and EGF domain-containing protein-like [Branchiostoma belcheri]
MRDTGYHDEDDHDTNYNFDFPNFVAVIPDWPSPSAQQFAENYCKQALQNSSMSAFCAEQGNVDIFSTLSQCVEDIKLTGDPDWASSALNTMEQQCSSAVLANVSMFEENENGTLTPPQAFVQKLCLNQCSFKGICADGECICNDGWIGKDCGVVADTAPVVWDLKRGGLCDIRQRPCEKVNVFGKNLLKSENLTCRVAEASFQNGQWTKSGISFQTSASFESFTEIACYLPPPKVQPNRYHLPGDGTPSYGLYISISNEGVYFSDELLLIIYDSVCQNCVEDSACSLKDGSCLIRGYCFQDQDSNPDDWCQQCLSSTNTSEWSRREVNQPPSILSSGNITKVQSDSFTVMIAGHDPEGRPMSFSASQNLPHGLSLSPDGFLTWISHGPDTFAMDIILTDQCGAQDVQAFTFSTIPCPCNNNGVCVPSPGMPIGEGHYDCLCQPGFTGPRCDINTNECQSSPCQNNGTCIDLVNSFICNCPVGFIGEYCATFDECSLNPCFPGVQCQSTNAGHACGDCPPGYHGDGMTCTQLPSSCNNKYHQMKNSGELATDGIYMIDVDGQATPVYCDMSRDGGGWTLIVTSKSMAGWDKGNVLSYNEGTPTTDADYSILGKADRIKISGASTNVVQVM